MAPTDVRGVGELVPTSIRWISATLLLVLSALLLPFPESPLLLGAVLAVVLWAFKRYRS
jgi:hypothetical protein